MLDHKCEKQLEYDQFFSPQLKTDVFSEAF